MVQRPSDDFEIFDEEAWRASSRGNIDNQLKRAVFEELRIDHLYNGDQTVQPSRMVSESPQAARGQMLSERPKPGQPLHDLVPNPCRFNIDLELLTEPKHTPEEQMARHMSGSFDWLMTVSESVAAAAGMGDKAPPSQRDETIYGCNIMSFSGKKTSDKCEAVAAWAKGDTLINLIVSPLDVQQLSMYTSSQTLTPSDDPPSKTVPEQTSAEDSCSIPTTRSTVRSTTGHFQSTGKPRAVVESVSPRGSTKCMKTLPRSFKPGQLAAVQSSSDTCTDEDYESSPQLTGLLRRGKECHRPSTDSRVVGTGSLRDSLTKGRGSVATAFELPGDAVARRLKAQREARRERQAAEAAKSQQQQARPRWR